MKFDEKVKKYWKNYLLQSFIATFFVFLALSVFHMQRLVAVASLGATAFIVFAIPSSVTAKKRNVIGGHITGILCGLLFRLLSFGGIFDVLAAALAVGLAMFIMVVFDFEHPPAAGTALSFVTVTSIQPLPMLIFIVAILILGIGHDIFKKHLIDLV